MDERGASASPAQPTYVLLILCLDQAAVIGDSLGSLLELPAERTHVVVIDDGSDDDTAAVALTYPRDRVTVLQRQPPHARERTGAALRAGLRMVRRMSLGDPHLVVVGVLQTHDPLGPATLAELDRRFADPSTLGTRLDVDGADRTRSGLRRSRRDRDLTSLTPGSRAGQDWADPDVGRFVRLSALSALSGRS